MKTTIRFSAPNSMFFFEDPAGGKSSQIHDLLKSIWFNTSCVIVGCYPSQDGETELTTSTSEADAMSMKPAFDGVIDTPTRRIEVSTSEREILMRHDVTNVRTRVRVWTDEPFFAKRILVVLG